MPDSLLRMDSVRQEFGGLVALDDVNLDVLPGEIHGLIGPNGAGKTTLLNVLTGIYHPTAGTVRIEGEEITGLRPDLVYQRGVARTFQNIRIWPQLTILENVMVGTYRAARIRPWDVFIRPLRTKNAATDMADRAFEALRVFGLEERASAPADSLPYGRRRLLEMARAYVGHPKLLLLDEPVAGLNPAEASDLEGRIRKLRDSGISVLLIEHNMRFVMNLCDRISVLNFGKKLATGTPEEIRSSQEVVDAYLGTGGEEATATPEQ